MIVESDCIEALKNMLPESLDSLVTDPPAGIGFMGKSWESNKGGRDQWIAWLTEVMRECFRVLNPGAHGLVWALPRTSHWTATALENAGFQIRDVVTHLFGSGFPKSHNLGNGYGTALKPASEHWILIRKPISEKTVAANVLKHGTGGINVDSCRIGTEKIESGRAGRSGVAGGNYKAGMKADSCGTATGRFPANLVLSHNEDCDEACTEGCAVAMLDEQSGELKSGANPTRRLSPKTKNAFNKFGMECNVVRGADSGGASRFFYCAKASKSEKGAENNHPTVKSTKLMQYLIKLVTPKGGNVLDPFAGSGSTGVAAIKSGFNFVGIENNSDYAAIAKDRLAL